MKYFTHTRLCTITTDIKQKTTDLFNKFIINPTPRCYNKSSMF